MKLNSLILLAFFIFSGITHGKILFRTKEPVCRELSILIQSLQYNEDSLTKEKLFQLDKTLSPFKIEDINFIVKSEIIKFVLTEFLIPNHKINLDNFNETAVDTVKSNHPFTRWLKESLRRDISILKANPLYNDYKRQLLSGKSLQIKKYSKFNRKVLIASSLLKLLTKSLDDFEIQLNSQLNNLFNNIQHTANFMRLISTPKIKNHESSIDNMAFFEPFNTQNIKKEPIKKKIIIETVEEVIKKEKKKEDLKVSTNWIPKDENAHKKRKDLFPDADPSYIPPDELPKPTNEWLIEELIE